MQFTPDEPQEPVKSNVIPFTPPEPRPEEDCCGDMFEDACEGCPLLAGPDALIPVPEDDPTWDDLAFTAKRLMIQQIGQFDWSKLEGAARFLYSESDARTVVKLMKNAEVKVIVSGA